MSIEPSKDQTCLLGCSFGDLLNMFCPAEVIWQPNSQVLKIGYFFQEYIGDGKLTHRLWVWTLSWYDRILALRSIKLQIVLWDPSFHGVNVLLKELIFRKLLGYTVAKAPASPRNLTWFTRQFLLVRGWGLGTRLGSLRDRLSRERRESGQIPIINSSLVPMHPGARLPARNGLVNEVEFLGLIPQNGERPMRLRDC